MTPNPSRSAAGAGSNKVVVNPGTGGVIQRRARAAAERLHLAGRGKRVERPLHGALAGAQRQRQRRARPRLAVGEEGEHRPHAPLRPAAPARRPRGRGAAPAQTLALSRSRPASVAQLLAQPPDFDAQPRAMRFIGVPGAEGARDERAPRHVSRPRFAERAREREQHRTRRERDHCACHRARHDGRHRRRAPSTPATSRPRRARASRSCRARSGAPRACSGCGDALSTSADQRGDAGLARGCVRPGRAPRAPPSSAGAASRSRRRPVRGRRATPAERARGRGRRACARPRRGDRSGAGAGSRDSAHVRRSAGRRAVRASPAPRRAPSPAKPRSRETSAISASATTHRARATASLRTEGARGASQQRLGAIEIAELRHGDAAQRQRRRVVAQRDPLQCAEGITRGERARRGRDQRVHRNPATLVTPTVRCPDT